MVLNYDERSKLFSLVVDDYDRFVIAQHIHHQDVHVKRNKFSRLTPFIAVIYVENLLPEQFLN